MRNNLRIYLDWAAAAPVSEAARKAFVEALEVYGNPSSPHEEGELARAVLENARKRIAKIAGVKSEGVIFTSGATEANAIAIQGNARSSTKVHMLYLPTAHASVVETMKCLENVEVEALKIADGGVDLEELKKQLRPETGLVSMDLICGETGTRYDTRDVRRVIDLIYKDKDSRPVLHVDASQAPFVESIDANHLGADLITLDAQKIGGVRGIGAIIRTRASIMLSPLMYGGEQEQGIRPGTENPALATAFAIALEEAEEGREEFKARAEGAREKLLSQLSSHFSEKEMVINVGKEFAPHIVNISFPGRDTDYAVMLLSQAGFALSTKSACETNEAGSRVVLELTGSPEIASSTLRVSFGPAIGRSDLPIDLEKDLKEFAEELIRTIHFLDAHAL